jgi:hypothetical protein
MDRDTLDWEKLEEVAMALLALTFHEQDGTTRAWKTLDWDLTDKLHARGWIASPVGPAKSVFVTEEGVRQANAALERHFQRKA